MKKGSWLWDFVQLCVGFGSVMAASVADMIYSCLYARQVAVKKLNWNELRYIKCLNDDISASCKKRTTKRLGYKFEFLHEFVSKQLIKIGLNPQSCFIESLWKDGSCARAIHQI